MLYQSLITDLTTAVNSTTRLHRAMQVIRAHFECDAVVLLKEEEQGLHVRASFGLVTEANGRNFRIDHHPRLAAILHSRDPVRFPHASDLPDPYDGLLVNMSPQQLEVHDCMGISLHLDGQRWGALTLDASRPGTFNTDAENQLRSYALLLEAMLRTNRLERDNHALRLASTHKQTGVEYKQGHIIGRAENFTQTLRDCSLVASSDLPVLIQGETGTGKELVAEYIHQHSPRSHLDMVYVNCAALPETLAESELFGHIKGAFSGAHQNRPGRFEQAHQSTLFLDEVGELPLSIQAKLLRVLQSGDIQRLGSDKSHKVDVRIVAATNRNLTELVREEAFRPDLFHRLSVFPVQVPPLRERGQDILELAGHFLEQNRARLGFRSLRLSAGAEQLIMQYSWPGNVRELEHVISRATIQLLAHQHSRHDIVTLDESLLGDLVSTTIATQAVSASERIVDTTLSLREQVLLTQRAAIQQALQAHEGKWAAAARALQVDASNLHKLARKIGLKI